MSDCSTNALEPKRKTKRQPGLVDDEIVYGFEFCGKPDSTMLGETVFDSVGEPIGWIVANVVKGTCEMEWVSDWMGWHCKACDSLRLGLPDQKPNFCPNCGAKVVDA